MVLALLSYSVSFGSICREETIDVESSWPKLTILLPSSCTVLYIDPFKSSNLSACTYFDAILSSFTWVIARLCILRLVQFSSMQELSFSLHINCSKSPDNRTKLEHRFSVCDKKHSNHVITCKYSSKSMNLQLSNFYYKMVAVQYNFSAF